MNRPHSRAGLLAGFIAWMAAAGCGSEAAPTPSLATQKLTLADGPDFVVTAVTGPKSAGQGQSITASVTVCNQGTQGDSTWVEVYLSSDTVISPPVPPGPPTDFPLGGSSTQYLSPGQCQTLSVSGSPGGPPPGAYYLGAVVDPPNQRFELVEDNNTLAGSRIGIGSGADFVVSSVTGPKSALQNQPFTASVTVCNQGTQSDSTRVEVFLSSDTVISPPLPPGPPTDFPLGGAYTDVLAPGRCQTLSVSGSAWNPALGAYYLGAVADPLNNQSELIEDNNALAGSRIGIGSGADFVVSAVTGPVSASLSQSITTSVTVCNQGTVSDGTRVEAYLSSDAVISPALPPAPPTDFLLGSAYTDVLAPGQCQTLSIPGLFGNPPPGAYFLGAAVDPLNDRPELIEDNNTLAGSRIGIGSGADFVVSSVTGPKSAQQNQSITASVTVCNQGTQSDSTRVEVFLSSDTVISPPVPPGPPTDFPLGNAHSGYLAPGQCQTLSISGSAWSPAPGAYYLGAVVYPLNGRPELIEDNNTLAGSRIGIGSGADFVVSSVSGPKSVQQNQPIIASVSVCNQGTLSESAWVEVYLSSSAVSAPPGSPTDFLLGGVSTGSLAPGQCQSLLVPGSSWSSPPGAYSLVAVVDPKNDWPELIEDNNRLTGGRIGIGSGADFVVSAVTGPKSALQNQTITASVTVCNQGTQSDSTRVEIFLSSDPVISPPVPPGPPADFLLGSVNTPSLAPEQCQTLSVSGSAWSPAPGAYYLGAVADPQNSRTELIEDNNSLAGSRIGIGSGADFVVTAVTGPKSASQSQSMTASVTVCNQGTLSDSTWVEVFLSSDAVISPSVPPGPPTDFLLGGTATRILSPGQCQTLMVSGSAWSPAPGAYYLGAVADPQNDWPELIEDNNSLAGSRIGIGSGADFVVVALTGPKSAQQNQPITVSVAVCNQGTLSESTRVEVLVSSDTVISPAQPPGPPADVLLGSVNTPVLAPGYCQTLQVSGIAWSPAPGAYYLGAVVDPQNSRPELIEDNNTLAGSRIGIGTGADFVVSALTGPASASRGKPFTASVTVCNQGTQSQSTRVELFLSSDSLITPPGPTTPPFLQDQPLGSINTSLLTPGQCQTLSVQGIASPPSTGAYFLGAMADPQNTQYELIEDNNAKAGSTLSITP
ncbi:CARDB domain-containing protein [Stigmatella sp. ncwal1]|uniref:CARDB domain-containing protein n=1 Tax=Stigmatella ashevillensis TaxID=2995309 RepID=A0ABT5DFC5_9BACT|nr:CARDB domain-containing protein [Stigmatella ashevillena]MDC0712361.1 CARDB domain-containing protein [Stigmatella ashevillena]